MSQRLSFNDCGPGDDKRILYSIVHVQSVLRLTFFLWAQTMNRTGWHLGCLEICALTSSFYTVDRRYHNFNGGCGWDTFKPFSVVCVRSTEVNSRLKLVPMGVSKALGLGVQQQWIYITIQIKTVKRSCIESGIAIQVWMQNWSMLKNRGGLCAPAVPYLQPR